MEKEQFQKIPHHIKHQISITIRNQSTIKKICCQEKKMAKNLKKHINTIHLGHKDYKCEFCGKSFSEAGSFKRHIQNKHDLCKDKKCDICSKSFSTTQ